MTNSRACSPKYATRRRPERETFGGELETVGRKLRQPFMPWQSLVAEVSGEIDPETGLPAYSEVIVTVPRQSGKTTLFLSWQIHRCTAPRWPKPQRSAFTAQSGKDARDKWLDELFPLIKGSPLNKFVRQYHRGMGNEAIHWWNGSVIRILSTSDSSGHSKTLHQATLDEIWHDGDSRREQGLRPAMITIPDKQLLVCSTAGTDKSVVLNEKIKLGRAAAAADTGSGVAYFEYGAPKGWDPYDDESYYPFHPALCPDPPCRCDPDGQWRHTITIDAIRAERDGLRPSEFARAYGNIPDVPEVDREIPEAVWRRVCDPDAVPAGQLRLGLDVAEDRSSGAITACGGGVIELVHYQHGVGGLFDVAQAMATKHEAMVVIDDGGPARYLADDLDDAGVRVERLGAADVAAANSRLYDSIADQKVTFAARGVCERCEGEPHPVFDHMDDAVEGLASKPAGDRKVFSRAASTSDISPLMSASLAWRPGSVMDPFVLIAKR